MPPGDIRFLAGWRNGRAAATRSVLRALAHPDYAAEPDQQPPRSPMTWRCCSWTSR